MCLRGEPLKGGEVLLQKLAGPNGKPVIHMVGNDRGRGQGIEEELRATLVIDKIIDNICAMARENKYQTVAMPIISGGAFGFNEVAMGTILIAALLRKNAQTEWPRTWVICHPNANMLKQVKQNINRDTDASERRLSQETEPRQRSHNFRAEALEYEPDPNWLVLNRVKTSRGEEPVENPFPKLNYGRSFETFRLGKGTYRPTHARSKKYGSPLARENQWDDEYAPGITDGQVWCLRNRGDARAVFADTTLTCRVKRAILAQKYLLTTAALERNIRNGVGNERYEDYFSDAGTEGDEPESESESGEETDPDYERLVRASHGTEPHLRRPSVKAGTPVGIQQTPRRLRFRDGETEYLNNVVIDPQDAGNAIAQHIQALHLGTPGQRLKTPVSQGRSPMLSAATPVRLRANLVEMMQRDQEMKLLKKAKLKNTTLKGRVGKMERR